MHKVNIYLEYHSVCPLVRIGTPHPLSRKRMCPPPLNQRGGTCTRLLGKGYGSQLGSLALCLLCASMESSSLKKLYWCVDSCAKKGFIHVFGFCVVSVTYRHGIGKSSYNCENYTNMNINLQYNKAKVGRRN